MINICSRIVVPYDGSELSKKALETAVTFAKQDEKIELNVITVVDVSIARYYGANSHNIESVRKAEEAEFSAAKEALDILEESLKSIPNKTKTFTLKGSPAATIVDFIKENNIDLVVMGSRGLSGLKEMFLGSVSHNVVQKSPCPVFIVK